MRVRQHEQGSLLLGMAGLIALLSVLCAIILTQSGEAYRAAGAAEARMRSRAAAEGAVVLILHSQQMPSEKLSLAGLNVTFGTATNDNMGMIVPIRAGTQAWQFNYMARFVREMDGRFHLLSLEMKR